jgi:Type II secretory pathway, component PulD
MNTTRSLLFFLATVFLSCTAYPKKDRLIPFHFIDADLTTVIKTIAQQQKINILLPQGTDALNQKVTINFQNKIPASKALDYLDSYLELAGYARIPYLDGFKIVKSDASAREILPLYINTPPQQLPSQDQRIRAIYYLAKIKVPDNIQAQDPVAIILQDMLSNNKSVIFDTKSNGIIIEDTASAISSAMTIILELDETGIAPTVETITLHNISAEITAQLLKTQLLVMQGQPQSNGYFNASTRVIADNRTNSLILMGQAPALNRIKDFIQEIDVPTDSGESLLHFYDLEYLDAEKFAPVLQRIASNSDPAQSTQATAASPTRFFEGVIVVAEISQTAAPVTSTAAASTDTALKGTVFTGGNNLIIAARNKDWAKIQALIKDLDKPEPQVIIEMLIVDIDISKTNLFAMQIRNPSGLNLPPGVNFQVPNITGIIYPNSSAPASLATDLFSTEMTAAGFPNGQNQLIMSFNDPAGTGIWGVLDIIDKNNEVKVLSRPHMVLLNHKKGETTVSDIRRSAGDSAIGLGTATVSKQVDVEAALTVSITPHISSADQVTLNLLVTVDSFESADPTDQSRNTRKLTSNTKLSNGQVLVCGGLIQDNTQTQTLETPLLGKIPILGRLFRSDRTIVEKKDLTIFVAATVVEPKNRNGINQYTRDAVKSSDKLINEYTLFSGLKDPVTQLFFTNTSTLEQASVDGYCSQSPIMNKQFVAPAQKNKNATTQSTTPEIPGAQEPQVALPAVLNLQKLLVRNEPLKTQAAAKPTIEQLKLTPTKLATPAPQAQELIDFNFDNKELASIINDFAARQKINIIFPQGPDALTQKITFKLAYKIPFAQAEQFLNTFLEMSGYSKVPSANGFKIIKNSTNSGRETLPLFINIAPDKLPKSEKRIRVIYYLENLKVPATPGQDQLSMILEDMLTINRSYIFDTQSNGIIIADTANAISSVMHLILDLDKSGTPPSIQVVPVFNAPADTIAQLIKTQILIAPTPTQTPNEAQRTAGYYFNPTTRILTDGRTNRIILLGQEPALNRIHELIESLDQPADSGNSLLHYYDLQYLDATDFAPVLQKLVASPSSGVGQSTQGTTNKPLFTGVIVIPEGNKSVIDQAKAADTSFANINNRLVITAQHNDWIIIETLLNKLDKPERQVIIESMIVNLETGLLTSLQLGSQIRNPSGLGLPPGVNFQTTDVYGRAVLTDPAIASPNTLAADLAPAGAIANSIGEGGPFVATLNDPAGTGIWGVLTGDCHIEPLVIISLPFLTTANHKKASIESSNIQRYEVFGAAVNSAITVNYVDQTSSIKLEVTPHINSENLITLQLAAELSEFVVRQTITGQPSQKLRKIGTQARITNGSILAFGGFPKMTDTVFEYKTPILSSIPLFGWLFKRKGKQPYISQLIFFLKPTIVEPTRRNGLHLFTKDMLAKCADTNIDLDNPHDPITQLFFKPLANKGSVATDIFLSEAEGNFVKEKINRSKIIRSTPINSNSILPLRQIHCLRK